MFPCIFFFFNHSRTALVTFAGYVEQYTENPRFFAPRLLSCSGRQSNISEHPGEPVLCSVWNIHMERGFAPSGPAPLWGLKGFSSFYSSLPMVKPLPELNVS